MESKKLKSPSQRLRGALYILYSMDKHEVDFETWYSKKIDYFIKAVGKKIDEKNRTNQY